MFSSAIQQGQFGRTGKWGRQGLRVETGEGGGVGSLETSKRSRVGSRGSGTYVFGPSTWNDLPLGLNKNVFEMK